MSMHELHAFLILIIQIYYLQFGTSQFTEENESCELDSGRTGACIHIEKCPQAIKQINNGERPRNCGFSGIYPIVCCEIVTFRSSLEPGLIARQKCEEYAITSITTTTTTTTTARPLFDPYVIRGADAGPLEFPHMAVLGYGSSDNIKWQCGGSLISEYFVLTAAHCLRTRLGDVQYVRLGVHQLHYVHTYEETFKVQRTYKHAEYTGSEDYHDIGLIELDHPANIQSGVKPACLHTQKKLPTNLLVATGWGATAIYGVIHDTLQKANLTHVPTDACTTYYNGQKRLANGVKDDWQLCADGGETKSDTCQGDSGGPLQTRSADKSLHTIVGITSTGLKCAVVPGIYTRVSNYVPWIESVVWPNK